MTGYIYIHTNKINGKKYVGQTIQRPEDRWQNGTGYKESPKFWNAIKKYGWDNFEHEIIPAYPEELDFLECEFIKKYDTVKNGYNSMYGGQLNRHHSQETKDKISKSNKGKIKTDTWRENLSKSLIGNTNWNNYNCFHARDTKVFNIDTGIIYSSCLEAAKACNCKSTNIVSCCKGHKYRKTAGGYHWRYVE